MEASARIFVAGARGMVGSALVRCLERHGYGAILGPGREKLDLTDLAATEAFFARNEPEYVFLAAAKVGGIQANSALPADFILRNLRIQTNVIDCAHRHGVRKLLFLGSPCIYPKHADQPMREDSLMSGPLEPTSEAYAIAKIAGLRMCQAYNRQFGSRFITCMPTNLYGPNDNYRPDQSHVLPALIRKVHDAKEQGRPAIEVWGSGEPRREFLYADDLAEACLLLMRGYDADEIINVGSGEEVSIRELFGLIKSAVGYGGELVFDTSRPDGAPRKVLDGSRMAAMGWKPKVGLEAGIRLAYADFLSGKVRK